MTISVILTATFFGLTDKDVQRAYKEVLSSHECRV
jgi:hypothetical protein